MTSRIQRNQQFLTDLFAGPFRGHAIIVNPAPVECPLGDFLLSDRPVREWLPTVVAKYEAHLAQLMKFEDDSVPYVNLNTHTGVFASGFGCKMVRFEGSNAAALHCVKNAAEADRLPARRWVDVPQLVRYFEMAELAQRELGPDVPVSVPDIQSPFDIAALVWDKEDLFAAMIETPAAVKTLVAKCHQLLKGFLQEFQRRFPAGNFIHCPNAWAPQRLGCSLSEDEAGSLSQEMFEEFCLPSLIDLSETFGGLFMHCCARADHQYANFRKIPNLRGLNRVFQYPPGPRPAVECFSGHTVLVEAWMTRAQFDELLDLAQPTTRYLLNLAFEDDETTRPLYDHLRTRCPRKEP